MTSYGLDAYRSHDLNIKMRTSSGDVIKMDFANEQSMSYRNQKDENSSSTSMSFSSMQSFQFSIETNGIDAQDKKEIEAFMKIAQPFIDSFLKELKDAAPKSPVTELAHTIAAIFEPNKERSEEVKNHIKTNIVKMFDNSLEKVNIIDNFFEDAKKLLEKTLEEFDEFNKKLYA
ncbi:hypothetical protein [Sulfurimonas sp.]|uniref:hypothetical protein n=1 Tax=Sulfurimonas sp. TaxID=2022749 RepID=UPI002B47867F|nr:hypothetical protein [Sulfurimonas sp.]